VAWPGCQLVVSDAHEGLKAAIGSVLLGASWQRFIRVRFLRNVLAVVPKGSREMVAAAIRTIFAQPDAEHVHGQFEQITAMLGRQLPKVEAMMRVAAAEASRSSSGASGGSPGPTGVHAKLGDASYPGDGYHHAAGDGRDQQCHPE
jgi:hypothetical protein